MNTHRLQQLLQTSWRATLGAASTVVENVQSPPNLQDLKQQLTAQIEQLAQKGELTEQEIIRLVDNLKQRGARSSPNPETQTPSPTTTASEVQELTRQLAALRAELQANNESKNS
jgi:polyhydroxyalkanoate synthesis regulator phasin